PVPIAPESLRERVEILSRGFGPRDADHPENLAKIAAYLASEFKSHGARVSVQEFEVEYNRYRNVIAEYGRETGEVIVIGAHYDTAGAQPGADDNASGVAGLLELSRLLSRTKPSYRIMLAAYTLEEPPYFRTQNMGSAVHAKSLRQQGVAVKLMISLEMIGYFSNQENSQKFPLPLLKIFYPSQGNFILVVDRLFSNQGGELKKWMIPASDLPVYSINAPAIIPGVDFSDHLNFWNHGYPAVMVTDTAFLRNDAYHTGRDTADRLDYTKMAKVVQGVYRYVTQGEQTK
ncbi:MAG: peptidase M28, partial [Deltaproteobacteria bacterium]|nr:peptidase M28 [Deltaproteobacteria bacterium]